jgi:hypothetical protein
MKSQFLSFLATIFAFTGVALAADSAAPLAGHVAFSKGKIHAHLFWESGPNEATESILRVEFKNGKTHEAIDPQATLTVEPHMPKMNHGAKETTVTQAVDAKGQALTGVYKVSNIFFSMPGAWVFRLTLTKADGSKETKKFKVSVKEGTASTSQTNPAQNCSFHLQSGSLKAKWTAFKTTARLHVDGEFKSLKVDGSSQAGSFAALVKGLKVVIDRRSADTGNPVRNQTITSYFFEKLAPEEISGTVRELNETAKTLVLALTINGQTHDIPMTYTNTGDIFTAQGSFLIPDFGADAALGSLHDKCVDLHKGPDGVSKTWPDVSLTLQGQITSTCP